MATAAATVTAFPPPPDPTKGPPPPPIPKAPLPVATSTLPKELQGTASTTTGAVAQPATAPAAPHHYFGVWTAIVAVVVLVAIALTIVALTRDR